MSRVIAYNSKRNAEKEEPMEPECSRSSEFLNQVIASTRDQLNKKRKLKERFQKAKKARLSIPKATTSAELKTAKRKLKAKKPQNYLFYPSISCVQRRIKKKERLVKAILKYEVPEEPKKKKVSPEREEDRNIQLLLLAIDSICRCRGLVDEILKPRPEITDLVPLRNFKYVLFEKAIGLVEEFNSIMRVLVKKILDVDIVDAFSESERILNSNLVNSLLEYV